MRIERVLPGGERLAARPAFRRASELDGPM